MNTPLLNNEITLDNLAQELGTKSHTTLTKHMKPGRVGLLSTSVRSSIKGRTNLRFVTIAESNHFV